jgi:tetratricopeptide (TPR) repeat protein
MLGVYLAILLLFIMSAYATSEGLDIQSALQNAIALHKNGKLDDAIIAYLKVVKKLNGVEASKIFSNIGAIHMSRGNYDMASRFFVKSIENNDQNSMAMFNLAVVYTSKLNEHNKAL